MSEPPSPAESRNAPSSPSSLRPSDARPELASLTPGALPAELGDRLLVGAASLPVHRGVAALAHAIVALLAELLPGAAVGICVAGAGDDGEQRTFRRLADGSEPEARPSPTRLFPWMAHERAASVVSDPPGTTIHCACDDVALASRETTAAHVLERAALVASGALRATRRIDHARAEAYEARGLRAQIIQSEKLAGLGQIAAGVVHELNNPLTSIVAYTDFLRKKGDAAGFDEGDVERLRRIGEAAERILRFSRDLVAYARPATTVPGPVPLHACIQQALVFCEHVLTKSNVDVHVELSPSVGAVRGVSGQLTQVFVNLFTNACHAMRAGGTLRVRTEPCEGDGTVRVLVADDGPGIEHDHLARIFEPFFTTKSEGEGSGLGLSIVRNIVSSHGGTIRAESAPGCGATFVVELPVTTRATTMPPPSPRGLSGSS